jgi:hypothetical protein
MAPANDPFTDGLPPMDPVAAAIDMPLGSPVAVHV